LLFYGPNGFGKTSLAEAIEWLFYGTTKRRQRGDGYSRSEYAGSFANAHNGQPVEVGALVSLPGGDVHLSRRLVAEERSETYIDGNPAPFSAIGISAIEAVYPVVAQHGLQTLIHSKPKDRRDAICAALGLDEVTAFKSALDGARTSFQRSPPRSVTEARRDLLQQVRQLGEITETAAMASRWTRTQPQFSKRDDIAALLLGAKALTNTEVATIAEALDALRTRRTAIGRAVFDTEKIRPSESSAAILESLAATDREASERLDNYEAAITAAIAAMAASYPAIFLE
jgi:DNA repair exonuclease SbcCD ATPase subunit